MALSESEKDWAKWISGKSIDDTTIAAETKRSADKMDFLSKIVVKGLGDVRGEIDEAQQLIVARTKDPMLLTAAWRKMTGSKKEDLETMPWRATDEQTNTGILEKYQLRVDVEIDTREDIDKKTKLIGVEELDRLKQSFERILQMEKTMRMQFDDEGQPLFTDEDIRNELYTPLVRSGLIPDNMVPAKFSEHAVAFKGAQEMYAKKIEAFTATTSKAEQNWKMGLRIVKEAAVLSGALVSGTITAMNSGDVAEQTKALKELQKQKESMPKGTDTKAIDDQISAMKTGIAELNNMTMYADAGTTLLVGGISVAEMAVEHHYTPKSKDELAKWMKTLSKGLDLAQAMAIKGVTVGITSQSADGGVSEKNLITCITCAMSAGFTGVRMVPSLALMIQEPDEAKRAQLIAGLVADLGNAIADSIIAATANVTTQPSSTATKEEKNNLKQDDSERAAYFRQIAGAVRIAITQAGNGPAIIKAYQAGDFTTVASLMGGMAVSTVFSASSEAIFDKIREDKSQGDLLKMDFEDQQFAEVSGSVHDDPTLMQRKQETAQDVGMADIMDKLNKEMQTFDKVAFKGMKPNILKMPEVSAEALTKQLLDDVAKKQGELAEARVKKALTPEAMEEIMADVDAKLVGFEKLYSDAYPDPDVLKRTPEEIVQANAAIDRAMANTSELRMKVALINGMVGGAAGVLAALVPGTGAVVAAAKLVADLYALMKCVDTHNTWCDSMAVAMAGQSGAAAAIENTLHNAKIQLSRAAIMAILSALKVASETAKVFDPSGGAAAASATATMATAVVEFSYKMYKEAEIQKGFAAYLDARKDPGNRKAARKALRLNSTLAKCCIAYGAAIQGDIAAKQAVKASGLSIAALKSDKDICVRLVAYLENELIDDPVVLLVDYQKGTKWMPGTPALTLASWTSFKAAARKTAEPPLAEGSMSTPGIDRLLAGLMAVPYQADHDLLKPARLAKDNDANPVPDDTFQEDKQKTQRHKDLIDRQTRAGDLLTRLNQALLAYQPLSDQAAPHTGMVDAAKTYATLARAEQKVVAANLKLIARYPDAIL